jgi:hypothetical protein
MIPRRTPKSPQVAWARRTDVAENARTRLPKLAAAYFAEGRKLLAANPTPAELHALRLASKKFRYTIELFKSCYGSGINTRIDALKSIQQMLGDINDTVAAEHTIEAALAERTRETDRVARLLRTRGAVKAREFRKYWKGVFDAPGQERWWTDYLSRPKRARQPASRRPTVTRRAKSEGNPRTRTLAPLATASSRSLSNRA